MLKNVTQTDVTGAPSCGTGMDSAQSDLGDSVQAQGLALFLATRPGVSPASGSLCGRPLKPNLSSGVGLSSTLEVPAVRGQCIGVVHSGE